MVLIGLLIIAVVALVLGFVLSSTAAFIVSLAASVLAALLLIRYVLRERANTGAAVHTVDAVPEQASAVATPISSMSSESAQPLGSADAPITSPTKYTERAPTLKKPTFKKSKADRSTVESFGPPDLEVQVVDGKPDYHLEVCSTLAGADTVGIPLAQALEDGFAPCDVCNPPNRATQPASSTPPASASAAEDGEQVWVVDGYPEFHAADCALLTGRPGESVPRLQAVEDGFVACTVCSASAGAATQVRDLPAAAGASATTPPQFSAGVGSLDTVWVADGHPEYHVQGCGELAGLDSEPVPIEQAIEDGFQPCVVCAPGQSGAGVPAEVSSGNEPFDAVPAEAAPADGVSAAATSDVWVVDGSPEYHRKTCSTLVGRDAEAIPQDQAVEDGFTECQTCLPDSAHTPAESNFAPVNEAPSVGAQDDVWVVDGYPEYHRAGCQELAGLDAEPVPHDQAVEDGFSECTVCAPESSSARSGSSDVPAAGTSAEVAADVWVVDGYADFHRSECATLVGLNSEPIPLDQAVEDGFTECSVCRPTSATAVTSTPPVTAPAEPIAPPIPEPVLASGSEGSEPEVAVARDVWVVDGYPEFHRPECSTLVGLNSEPIPLDQAVEDGFAECSVCAPTTGTPAPGADPRVASDAEPEPTAEPVPESEQEQEPAAAGEPAPEAETLRAPEQAHTEPAPVPEAVAASEPEPEREPVSAVAEQAPRQPTEQVTQRAPEPDQRGGAQVWVVDGRPRFHTHDCLIIKGQPAIALEHSAAVSDGFLPCSLCQK